MKKIILCAAAALALAAGPAMAGDFSVYGSYWDTKDADEAIGVGAKARFGIVELRGTYFNDVTADTSPESRDFEVKAIPLEAGLNFQFAKGERFSPYLGGGASYFLLDTNRGDIDDELGWYGVVGADIGAPNGLSFMAEAIYRNVEATVTNEEDLTNPDIEDKVAFDLSGIGVNLGLVWRF